MVFAETVVGIEDVRTWLRSFEEPLLAYLVYTGHHSTSGEGEGLVSGDGIVSGDGQFTGTLSPEQLTALGMFHGQAMLIESNRAILHSLERYSWRYLPEFSKIFQTRFATYLKTCSATECSSACVSGHMSETAKSEGIDKETFFLKSFYRIHWGAVLVGMTKWKGEIQPKGDLSWASLDDLQPMITAPAIELEIRKRLNGLLHDCQCPICLAATRFFMNTVVGLTRKGQCAIIREFIASESHSDG